MAKKLRLSGGELVIPAADIATAVHQVGAELNKLYAKSDNLIVLPVMKGAIYFTHDLLKEINNPHLKLDAIRSKSYKGTKSNGSPSCHMPELPLIGADVLIVEDVLDTWITMAVIIENIVKQKPRTIRIASAFDKPIHNQQRSKVEKTVDSIHVAIHADNVFLLGYGMDVDELYRNLPFVTMGIETKPGSGIYKPRVSKEQFSKTS